MTKDEIKCILKKAADILTQIGWCQQKSVDSIGRVCMAQAVARATNDLYGITYSEEVVDYITSKLGCQVSIYNDTPGRQRGDVITKLHEMANTL